MGYPNPRSWKVRKETTHQDEVAGTHPLQGPSSAPPPTVAKPLRDESLQHRLPHVGHPPVRHFALDRKKVGEFLSSPSLSPPSFLETSAALRNAHDKKGREKAAADEEQAKERNKNPLPAPI